jgi:hypothetical protein
MMTKITPILAMHGHFGGRGVLLFLMVVAMCALIIAWWPGKSETK